MRDLLPNVVPALLALVSLEMGIAVIVEAILSFVGLSVSSDTPTWGGMIAEGRQFIHQAWWVFAAPLAAHSRPSSPSTSLATDCGARLIRCSGDDGADPLHPELERGFGTRQRRVNPAECEPRSDA
jgi:hypothetical protein